MAKSVASRLEKYKEETKEKVTVLLEKTFPEKILQLNDLLASERFNPKSLESIHTDLGVEPLLTPDGDGDGKTTTSGVNDLSNKFLQWNMFHMVLPPGGRVQTNARIVELFQLVSKLRFEFFQDSAAVKIAISYLVPKVEDGNNFGVEIQEETVKMVKEVEQGLETFWKDSTYSDYCRDRARFAENICKEPYLDDNRQGLCQLDETAFYNLVNVVTYIRDAYGKIHDVITKNIDKIKKPRTSNAANLF